jgi:hypothetical protein
LPFTFAFYRSDLSTTGSVFGAVGIVKHFRADEPNFGVGICKRMCRARERVESRVNGSVLLSCPCRRKCIIAIGVREITLYGVIM